ncbi:MAG: serine/threonine protein phosphatase, partial [Bdellovibrionales bacterium]|nr:serine/threonine protein phosphatase [Bdellovibrionales bacterium]
MASSKDSNIFVISDIHGCDTELKLLLNKLPLEPNKSKIIFLGDYIDRGIESKQVIDTIMELQGMFDVVTLMGNHEEMLINFLQDPLSEEAVSFVYNGGGSTLTSY